MLTQDGDELGRDGHAPGLGHRPVLEPALAVRRDSIRPPRLTSGRDFSRVKRWPRRQERPHLLRQGGVGQVEMGFGRVGHVDADQLGGIFQGEPVGDVAADVAAVSSETLIAEDGHELDPQARDAPDCPAVSG